MTTQVVNIEDTMPYVEPPKPATASSEFKESIAFSLEMAEEQEGYYRDSKSYAKANVQKDVAAVLTEVMAADYPETKMESVLDRLRRVYMELSCAQADALDAKERFEKKRAEEIAAKVASHRENYSRQGYPTPPAKPKPDLKVVTPDTVAEAIAEVGAKLDAQQAEKKVLTDTERQRLHAAAKEVSKVSPKAITAGTTK